jgi:hypothetical protein
MASTPLQLDRRRLPPSRAARLNARVDTWGDSDSESEAGTGAELNTPDPVRAGWFEIRDSEHVYPLVKPNRTPASPRRQHHALPLVQRHYG